MLGTGDGLSLPVGNAGEGLGPSRKAQGAGRVIRQRVPRNAQPLFNVGAGEFTKLFHDGRLMVDATQPGGFFSGDGVAFPEGLDNILAAQTLLPVISLLEMAGEPGENPIADAVLDNRLDGAGGAWDLLAQRLRENDEYVGLFRTAFADVNRASDITLVHAANAIAAFTAAAFRCSNSIFDQAIRGDLTTLSPKVWEGALLFYGAAGCASCHSGALQTDHAFHAIGVPQIGPGRGDNQPGFFDGLDDFGREQVTFDPADRFKFRTPSLRQVTQTGPWGHDGAYNDLEAMVRHHLDALQALNNYDTVQAVLPPHPQLDALDFQVQNNPARRQGIAAAIEPAPLPLNDQQVGEIMEFLQIRSDPACIDLRRHIPPRVPGGD
jgi:cytochrome c peroxidase